MKEELIMKLLYSPDAMTHELKLHLMKSKLILIRVIN